MFTLNFYHLSKIAINACFIGLISTTSIVSNNAQANDNTNPNQNNEPRYKVFGTNIPTFEGTQEEVREHINQQQKLQNSKPSPNGITTYIDENGNTIIIDNTNQGNYYYGGNYYGDGYYDQYPPHINRPYPPSWDHGHGHRPPPPHGNIDPGFNYPPHRPPHHRPYPPNWDHGHGHRPPHFRPSNPCNGAHCAMPIEQK